MHVGRDYPYHEVFYACTSQFWPGFVPRKMKISFALAQSFPWVQYAGFQDVSVMGAHSLDKEVMTYVFPHRAVIGETVFCEVRTAFPGGIKGTVFAVWIDVGGIVVQNGFDNVPGANHVCGHATWPFGITVFPNPGYVAPDVQIVPADWSEV